MRYESRADVLELFIPFTTPIASLRAFIEELPTALAREDLKYFLNVRFEVKEGVTLDEMALGCLLHQSDGQEVASLFQALTDVILEYNAKHSPMHRNEMVPLGLDLMFNYVVSLYQNYEGTNKAAYAQLARFMKAQDWDHVGYCELWLTNYVITKCYGFDTSEYDHLIS